MKTASLWALQIEKDGFIYLRLWEKDRSSAKWYTQEDGNLMLLNFKDEDELAKFEMECLRTSLLDIAEFLGKKPEVKK